VNAVSLTKWVQACATVVRDEYLISEVFLLHESQPDKVVSGSKNCTGIALTEVCMQFQLLQN